MKKLLLTISAAVAAAAYTPVALAAISYSYENDLLMFNTDVWNSLNEATQQVLREKAVEACRARVEAAMKSGEPVSVTNVIELVDRAIKNANTFFRRIGSAKKRYDSEDRIILREKDFR